MIGNKKIALEPQKLNALKIFMATHHRGKKNTIKSAAIQRFINGPLRDTTNPEARNYLFALTEKHGLPIGSTSTGYYVIETKDELRQYIESLKGRIGGIQKRIDTVASCFD
jgi:hypothetical protein